MMTIDTPNAAIWNERLAALSAYTDREGTALVPAKHVETVNGQECELGSWVSYVRTRYRNNVLPADRVAQLEAYPGWQWGPLRPGPKPDVARDAEIRRLRAENKSLQEIGTAYGLSRQRIHQIVST